MATKTSTVMRCLVMIGALTWAQQAHANGLVVTNVALWNQNLGQKSVYASFDLSWSNSWRTAVNWDAAWVFVKFRAPGSNNWQHATLSTNGGDHVAPGGCTVTPSPEGKGVFVYSSGTQTGHVSYLRTRLRWDYGTDGYNFAKGDPVEVSVHAIEMVYVPQSAFFIGSGGSNEVSHFYQYTDGSQSTNPFLVASETAITVGTANGNLFYAGGDSYVIPDTFPKGYAAFYCMKYEISQGQYADFLNRLTGAQWTNRTTTGSSGSFRHTISGTYTNCAATAPDRECNYLTWAHGCAYLAWAALRPMTELEFEKACRGSANPVPGEYAWGNAGATNMAGEAGTPGSGTETATPAAANANNNNVFYAPTRVGIFATATSGREQAGASYHGVLDMSGGLYERCVTVANPQGRGFLGTHGSGVLSAAGAATNADWTGDTGGGSRGGGFYGAPIMMCVSDRNLATWTCNWDYTVGFRGVRTAP